LVGGEGGGAPSATTGLNTTPTPHLRGEGRDAFDQYKEGRDASD